MGLFVVSRPWRDLVIGLMLVGLVVGASLGISEVLVQFAIPDEAPFDGSDAPIRPVVPDDTSDTNDTVDDSPEVPEIPQNEGNKTLPLSVIVMIGDGMGVNAVRSAGLVMTGDAFGTVMDQADWQNLTVTSNVYGSVTDSAAAATALATGVKTANGRISMDVAGAELTTIIELAKTEGYVIGVVTTTSLTHATPAGFTAHELSRSYHDNIAYDQFLLQPDLLLGGGLKYYRNTSYGGDRTGADLVVELEKVGYTYVSNRTELDLVPSLPVIGLFGDDAMTKEMNRTEDEPALSTMVRIGLDLLLADGRPFFLVVEGGQIDWGGHANNIEYMITETVEFHRAVEVAKNLTESRNDTLLLVTADHETGGLIIEGPSTFSVGPPLETDNLSTYWSKILTRAGELNISWSSTGHTNTPVLTVVFYPEYMIPENITDNTHIFDVTFLAVYGNYTRVLPEYLVLVEF